MVYLSLLTQRLVCQEGIWLGGKMFYRWNTRSLLLLKIGHKNILRLDVRMKKISERQTKAGNQEFQSLNVIENLTILHSRSFILSLSTC